MAQTQKPEKDVETAATKRNASTAGERAEISQGETTNPDYAGPHLVQKVAARKDGE